MRASGIVSEVGHASAIPRIQWTPTLIQTAKRVGVIDGVEVLQYDDVNHIFLLILSEDKQEVRAYMAIAYNKTGGHFQLVRISSSGKTGLVSVLVAFAINRYGPLMISNNEPLTADGLSWIMARAKKADGFRLTDINVNLINSDTLRKEWHTAIDSGESGETAIIIDVSGQIKSRISEQAAASTKQLFQPAYIFWNDNESK